MILATLKAKTRHLHERAEAALPLLDPLLTRPAYAEVLGRFWQLYVPLEAQVEHELPVRELEGLEWPQRRKTPLLERDLLALGEGRPTRPLQAPVQGDEAAAWGALYVMEGATLGGQVIRRQLERQLNLDGTGLAFFSSYGPLVGPRWQAFGAALAARHGHDPDHAHFERQAVLGAQQTFEAFIRAFAVPAEVSL